MPEIAHDTHATMKKRKHEEETDFMEESKQQEVAREAEEIRKQEKRLKKNEEDLAEKPAVLEDRAKAGEYVISFGQHKNKKLADLPITYLWWILGVQQKGRIFEQLPQDKTKWIKENAMDCFIAARRYMAWRCWSCGDRDTKFKTSKLCTYCWCYAK
jgi:hypothetical protein